MKKVFCLLTSVILIINISSAQKRNWEWKFGWNNALSFSSGVPVVSSSPLYTNEGTASISDTGGNFLFYTDGNTVWDASDTPMPNGGGLTGSLISAQSALIVPSPANAQQYYVFTVNNWTDSTTELRYSIVDMTLNGGMGDIGPVKNVLVNSNAREQLNAVPHANGQDVWIMIHEANNINFCAYLLTATGLVTTPVISPTGMNYTGWNRFGGLRFSHNCQKLVSTLGGGITLESVQLFDFDNATGVVSNPLTLGTDITITDAYSSEFSPDDSKLYVTGYDQAFIYQFDLNAPNILATKINIASAGGWMRPCVQLAPDGKIYAEHIVVNYLAVINFPDSSGLACGYVDNAVTLTGTCSLVFPNFYNYECAGTTSIPEYNSIASWSVFPNPFNDEINVNSRYPILSEGKAEIAMYDVYGREVLSQTLMTSNCRLRTAGFSPGFYFVKIMVDGKQDVKKIIKSQ